MEQADIERVRRVLHQRPKPRWRVLWRGRPHRLEASDSSIGAWARRRVQLQAGWQLLWTERLHRDLAPIYRLLACRRGRHRDAHVMVDELIGSELVNEYPEVAICEVCGRAVDWPNGIPTLHGSSRCWPSAGRSRFLFLLLQRPARFNELERAVPGLTNRVMADRLRELQDAGLVDRQVDPGPPITSIYTLTADGEALRPILEPLRPWADRRARK